MSAPRFSKHLAALCLSAAALYSPLSSAGSGGPGFVSSIVFKKEGIVLFSLGANHDNPPSCATATWRYAIDITTAAGKAQLAGLLTAYSSATPVVVAGTGLCDVFADTETVSYLYTAD